MFRILAIVGSVAGIVGLPVTLFALYSIFFSGSPTTTLELRTTSSLALAAPVGALSERIQIYFDDEEISQLWLATFNLVNTGTQDIGIGDFGGPILFSSTSVEIVELISGDSEPPTLEPRYSNIDEDHSFTLAPLFLKADDIVTFSVLSSSKLERLDATARIKDLDQIDVRTSLEPLGAEQNTSTPFQYISLIQSIILTTIILLSYAIFIMVLTNSRRRQGFAALIYKMLTGSVIGYNEDIPALIHFFTEDGQYISEVNYINPPPGLHSRWPLKGKFWDTLDIVEPEIYGEGEATWKVIVSPRS